VVVIPVSLLVSLGAVFLVVLPFALWKLVLFRGEWIVLRDRVNVLQPTVASLESSVSSLESSVSSLGASLNNIDFELFRHVGITSSRPERKLLAAEVISRLQGIQEKLTPILFPGQKAVGDLDHMYKLKTKAFPYSLTDEEGLILYTIIKENGLASAYEVATAFGYSTLFIALALRATGGTLVTLDAYIEEAREDFDYPFEDVRKHTVALRERLRHGDAGWPDGYRFADESLTALHLRDLVRLEVGISPDDVSQVLGDRPLDFALIDGGHHHGQPSRDLLAILDRLSGEKVAVFFHDAMVPDVAEAAWLCRERLPGSSLTMFSTRNCLTLVSRGLEERSVDLCMVLVSRSITDPPLTSPPR